MDFFYSLALYGIQDLLQFAIKTKFLLSPIQQQFILMSETQLKRDSVFVYPAEEIFEQLKMLKAQQPIIPTTETEPKSDSVFAHPEEEIFKQLKMLQPQQIQTL